MKDSEVVVTLVDGSDESRRAARYASLLADRAGARLLVVSPAVTDAKPLVVDGRPATEIREAWTEVAREAAARRLEAVRDDVGYSVELELRTPDVHEGIAEAVLEVVTGEDCLVVVLPKRGPRLLMRLLGDDTADIVKRSPVPVALTP